MHLAGSDGGQGAKESTSTASAPAPASPSGPGRTTPASTHAGPPPRTKTAPHGKPARAKSTKQKFDWSAVQKATDDPSDPFDIHWVKGTDPRVRASIDGNYRDESGAKRVASAIKRDRRLREIDAEAVKALAPVRAAVANKLGKGISPRSAIVDQDPAIQAVKATFAAARTAREHTIRRETEDSAPAGALAQSVAAPDGTRIRRADGQTLARANLMADVTDLTHDPEKVKAHFLGMRPVAGTNDMLLGADAAKRFEAARAAFETAHPGFTLPTTGNAFATRGLHQTRNGVGNLGHLLGLAFDLDAVANPNQIGPDGEVAGVNSYMLGKFGRDRSDKNPTGKLGRTQMDVSESAIEAVANPPIMQFLERGFIRDDAFEGGSQRRPKPTFNAEALSTLAKFGFSPGSKFGDTMHFDFIEGYSTLIDGGRSAANIRKDRASPENSLPVMPPTAAQLR